MIPSPSDAGVSPRIRWSKVMTAQARVAEGYYDRPEVRELLLSEVLNELIRN